MGLNIVALTGLAVAPGLAMLFAMMLVVGMTSAAAQMIVPLAANLAPAAQRGAVVGNVMTGLIAGIMLARPVSSFLADYVGWRGMFGLSAALIGALAVGALFLVPAACPTAARLFELIGSLANCSHEPVLRRRAPTRRRCSRLHRVLDGRADRPAA